MSYDACAFGHWTCRSSIGLFILKLGHGLSFILNAELRLSLYLYVGTFLFDIKFVLALDLHARKMDLSHQDWTCHFEAGLNIEVGMVLDSHVGTLDFAVQHWTCHFEVRPSARPMCTMIAMSFESPGGGRAPQRGSQDLLRWTSIRISDLAIFKTSGYTIRNPPVTRV